MQTKMSIKIACLTIIMAVAFFPSLGCVKKENPAINIGVLKGPTGIGAAYLMEQDAQNETKYGYNFTVAGSPDILTSQIVSGMLDVAALPSNVAATLYQKSEGQVLALAVSTLGVIYIMENGGEINSIQDLAGKTIVTAGQGATVEYVLNYLLAEYGLSIGKDVAIDYKSEHTEVATLAAAGSYDIALLPEPFVTSLLSKNSGFRVAIDITAAWEETGAGMLPMGVIAVNKDFAAKNAGLLTAFLSEYRDSVGYANAYQEQAAALAEKYDIMSAAVAKQAILRANIACITGPEMDTMLDSFYRILYDFNPASIGGAIPDQAFYYSR
jgi:NitT/TauT family transport system substrate-binding protein